MDNGELNYRQTLYVKYFTSDKECKGNAYKSAKKAGYTERTAQRAPEQLSRNIKIKQAIAVELALIEAEDQDSRVFIDNQFKALLAQCLKRNDRTNAARVLENMAKNRGYYALDNAQRQEQAKLTKAEEDAAHKIARIINLGLVPEINDVQGQGQAKTG